MLDGHSLTKHLATGHEQYGGIGTYLYGLGLTISPDPGNLHGHLPTSAQSGGQTQYCDNELTLQSNSFPVVDVSALASLDGILALKYKFVNFGKTNNLKFNELQILASTSKK